MSVEPQVDLPSVILNGQFLDAIPVEDNFVALRDGINDHIHSEYESSTDIQAEIDAEAAARIAQDVVLQASITSEITNRQAAVSGEVVNRDAAIEGHRTDETDVHGFVDTSLVPLEYEHLQTVPATMWVVQHNLGRYPAGIGVYDTSNDMCEGDIDYIDSDSIVINFSAPFSGRAKII